MKPENEEPQVGAFAFLCALLMEAWKLAFDAETLPDALAVDDPYQRLWGEVIKQAATDAGKTDAIIKPLPTRNKRTRKAREKSLLVKRIQDEAREWFAGPDFVQICDQLGLNSEYVITDFRSQGYVL